MQAAVYTTPVDRDFLLAHGADVNAANKADHTALMRAMAGLAKIKLLVEHEANVNAITSGGNTPPAARCAHTNGRGCRPTLEN